MTKKTAPDTAAMAPPSDFGALLTNALSLAIVAGAGLAISGLLGHYFGAASVGQFNQLATLHLLCAQVAAFGIHLSCLHYLSRKDLDAKGWAQGAQAALSLAAATGTLAALALWAAAGGLESLFDSPGLAAGLRWVAPAVGLFGMNKVVLALLNAADRLHSYAFLQALRPAVWLIGAALLVQGDSADPARIGQFFLAGEAAALVGGGLFLWRKAGLWGKAETAWFVRHARFGLRALPSHLIIELNTRIDVLVLSLFLPPDKVGIYSFAALLAEGIFQIGILVRTVINQRLVRALVEKNQAALNELKRHAGGLSLGLTVTASVILLAGFGPGLDLLRLDPALHEGHLALALLLFGISVCSYDSPFWMTLVLAGHPLAHTRLMALLCGLNLALNVALAPLFGLTGAAAATAAMFVAFPFLLRRGAAKTLGLVL